MPLNCLHAQLGLILLFDTCSRWEPGCGSRFSPVVCPFQSARWVANMYPSRCVYIGCVFEHQQCFRFFFSTNFGSFPTAFRRCYSQSPYRQELSGKRSLTDETPVYFQYVGNTQRIVNFHQPDFTIACFVYGFICNHWGFFHSRARLHLSLARCLDQLLLEKLFVGSKN